MNSFASLIFQQIQSSHLAEHASTLEGRTIASLSQMGTAKSKNNNIFSKQSRKLFFLDALEKISPEECDDASLTSLHALLLANKYFKLYLLAPQAKKMWPGS